MPKFLGKMEWGCQFSGGANFPVTPVDHGAVPVEPQEVEVEEEDNEEILVCRTRTRTRKPRQTCVSCQTTQRRREGGNVAYVHCVVITSCTNMHRSVCDCSLVFVTPEYHLHLCTVNKTLSRIARRLAIHSHSSNSEMLNAMYCRLGTVLLWHDAVKCLSSPGSINVIFVTFCSWQCKNIFDNFNFLH